MRQRLCKLGLHHLRLPSIIFGNVHSLRNKIDELQACVKCTLEYKKRLCDRTESWFKNHNLSQDYIINGFGKPIQLDRDAHQQSIGKDLCDCMLTPAGVRL